jgi:hypothetical protein
LSSLRAVVSPYCARSARSGIEPRGVVGFRGILDA